MGKLKYRMPGEKSVKQLNAWLRYKRNKRNKIIIKTLLVVETTVLIYLILKVMGKA
jgi:hypothetical protein